MANRLQEKYSKTIVKNLIDKHNYSNIMEVPKLDKIVINFGAGQNASNNKLFEILVQELELIAGQKPIITNAKQSNASFKLREDSPIGAKVTLRKEKMWNFLDKVVSMALPRVRDFRGLSPKSFDGKGNYSFGVKEQLIFPEIKFDKVQKISGYDITIVTTAKTNEEAKSLLIELGLPLVKGVNNG